jgi:hypothetical protein
VFPNGAHYIAADGGGRRLLLECRLSNQLPTRENAMLKQFEIHGGVVKNLNAFLAEKNTDLKTAMDDEALNKQVAAIIHEGLPGMVRRIYSLEKMQTFFWEKKDLMVDYVAARLEAAEKKAQARAQKK